MTAAGHRPGGFGVQAGRVAAGLFRRLRAIACVGVRGRRRVFAVDYSVGLYRSSFAPEFRVVFTSPRLDALARTASAEAIRLDEREAPQHEIERRQKEAEETRALQEKARVANKATFTP